MPKNISLKDDIKDILGSCIYRLASKGVFIEDCEELIEDVIQYVLFYCPKGSYDEVFELILEYFLSNY